MIASSHRVLEYVQPGAMVQVVDDNGQNAFVADIDRLRELAADGHICGYVKGSRLKYVELLVPLSEVRPPSFITETPGSINARTNIGAYKQELSTGFVYSLCFCRKLDGASA